VTVYNGIDFAVTLRFEEEEARFLAAVCQSLDADRLTENQRDILRRIAGKFLLGSNALKDELIEEHGFEGVAEAAGAALDAYPDIEDIR
jgi:hypothetical protein